MRDRLAAWLICKILHSIASRRMRQLWFDAVEAWTTVEDLREAIELVLLDHADELNDDAGTVDANLAELAFVYERLTGWTAFDEFADWVASEIESPLPPATPDDRTPDPSHRSTA